MTCGELDCQHARCDVCREERKASKVVAIRKPLDPTSPFRRRGEPGYSYLNNIALAEGDH